MSTEKGEDAQPEQGDTQAAEESTAKKASKTKSKTKSKAQSSGAKKSGSSSRAGRARRSTRSPSRKTAREDPSAEKEEEAASTQEQQAQPSAAKRAKKTEERKGKSDDTAHQSDIISIVYRAHPETGGHPRTTVAVFVPAGEAKEEWKKRIGECTTDAAVAKLIDEISAGQHDTAELLVRDYNPFARKPAFTPFSGM